MRSTYRTMLAAIVAVMALSAIAASAASAHEFRVAGSPLTETKKATGTGGTAELVWTYAGAKVHVECKSTTLADELAREGTSAGSIAFESCKIAASSACKVANFQYKFAGALAGSMGALTDEFLPAVKGSKSLFTLVITNAEGHTCSLKGEYPVVGKYVCALPTVEIEATEHEVACKPEGSELEINASKLTVSYSDQLRLTSGQKWSAT
jgi:hypothetical protein